MTYLHFHLIFLLPAIASLTLWTCYHQAFSKPKRRGLLFIVVIAVVYTTPWDNYLIAQHVWRYGQERVLAVVGYVPIEEYLFFALQPLLTGLWVLGLREASVSNVSQSTRRHFVRAVGGLAYTALGGIGLFLLQHTATTYLGLILVWSVPMLLLQWIYGGPWLWARRRRAVIGVAVPTLYLCAADRLAIEWGIWHISQRYTVELTLAGLPVEEALFFLVTNVLIVQGLLLAVRKFEVGWTQNPFYEIWQCLHANIRKTVTKGSL